LTEVTYQLDCISVSFRWICSRVLRQEQKVCDCAAEDDWSLNAARLQ